MVKIFSHFNKEEDKILRKVSDEVQKEEFGTQELKKIIDEMFQFIIEKPDGAGLSAPQIGMNKRIFVVNPRMFDYEKDGKIVEKHRSTEDSVFINPKIVKQSKDKQEIEEGCFSVRWYYGMVERPAKIKMEYFDFEGNKKEIGLSGFLSAVAQHEIDHLDGILFIDKAKNIRKLTEEEIKEIEESY